ncbi:O-antigen ligase family protein [Flavobacterium sp. K5-23]|uniref:O-antigen ligase family protein n=1 Tax=Flavobacterium sp. K5-23 TaxID=2746225 RepID=UPI0020108699|nr:O-antigen ligase family protein [Flavobacterium sp. K5-23]UQD57050.1 O-antigen ligase family protein [Flavobacterium sp. K5-23]
MSKRNKGQIDKIISSEIDNKNTYYDFILLLFIISLISIDFFPQFNSVEIIAPQFLYLSFINILTSISTYRNNEIFTNGIVILIKKSPIVIAYLGFLGFSFISMLFARNFSIAVVSFMQLTIVFCLFINLSILLYNRLDLIYKIAFIISIGVFIRSFIEISSIISLSKSNSLLNALAEIKGNTGNINIFAASLVGKIPFTLLGIFHFTNWKKWFLCLSLFLASLLVLLTASRASYIGLFIELFLFIVILIKLKFISKQNLSLLLYIILPLIISFFVANVIFKNTQNTDRYASITNRIQQISPINNEDSSINARLMYWDNAIQIIKEKPFFGIGIGNWKIEALNYEKEQTNNLLVSEHPHNDFLEIAAETGIANFIIYLLLFIFCSYINLKRIFSTNENQVKIIALIALLLLVTYGIDAMFNFPLYRPTMQLNFILFLALTLLNTTSDNLVLNSNYLKTTIIGITIISCLGFYFSYNALKAYQFENDTRIDLLQNENNYKLNLQEILNRMPQFPNTATNSQPYIEVAGIYALKEKKHLEALQYFNQSQKINPFTGRAEWYKYRIYKELNNQDSAYYYAKKAFEIRPRNEDYYLSALVVEANKKDTLAILKIHNYFSQINSKPSVWLNSSSALAQSQFSNKELIEFIDSGITLFPNDTTLLNRKKSFQNDFLKKTSNKENNTPSKPNYILIADQYGLKLEFDKALMNYKKALHETPNNPIIIQNIGICYFKLNQFNDAILSLEKTLNSPILSDGKSEYLIGAAYLNINKKEKGCTYLRLAQNKNYPGATELVVQYCK